MASTLLSIRNLAHWAVVSLDMVLMYDDTVLRLFLYRKIWHILGIRCCIFFIWTQQQGRERTMTMFTVSSGLHSRRIALVRMLSYSMSENADDLFRNASVVRQSGSCMTRVPGTFSNIRHISVAPHRPVLDIRATLPRGSPKSVATLWNTPKGRVISLRACLNWAL